MPSASRRGGRRRRRTSRSGRGAARAPGRRWRGPGGRAARRGSTATPWSAAARTAASSRSTTIGARPRDSSSASSTRGSEASTRPRASICCWPPESSPTRLPRCSSSSGKSSSALLGAAAAELEVLPAGQLHEDAALLGEEPQPAAGPLVQPPPPGVAVEGDRAGDRRDLTGEREQRRGLAGAVGAQQGHHLAGPAPRGRCRGWPACRRSPRSARGPATTTSPSRAGAVAGPGVTVIVIVGSGRGDERQPHVLVLGAVLLQLAVLDLERQL